MELQIINIVIFLGLATLVTMFIYLLNQNNSKEQLYLSLVICFTSFILLGHMYELNSSTMGIALMSRRITFLGYCFAEFFLLLFTLQFLNIKKPKWLIYPLLAFHYFTYMLVATCTRHNLFYYNISISKEPMTHLTFDYGVFAYFHMSLMMFYIIAVPTICIHFYVTHKQDPFRKQSLVLASCALLPGLVFILSFLGFLPDYDLTPVSFVLSAVLTFVLVFRGHIFDTLNIAREMIIEKMTDAVVVLDDNFHIIYLNHSAQELLPDISTNTETYQLVQELCSTFKEQFEKNGRYYSVHISKIEDKGSTKGYSLIFNDVTELIGYMDNLEQQVNTKVLEIEKIQQRVIMSFANMIEMRDDITGQHVKRTSAYVQLLTTELMRQNKYAEVLTPLYAGLICRAAPLHDIGKIAISDAILQKPGKLSYDEFEIIKTHSVVGGEVLDEILKDVESEEYLRIARDMAMYHHEKWDGSGYPNGLKGTEIPLEARIMAIADVFDALISKRHYKDAFPTDLAFQIIEDSLGSHFDPEIGAVFLGLKKELIEILNAEP